MLGPIGAITCTSSQQKSFTRLGSGILRYAAVLVIHPDRSLKWPYRSESGQPGYHSLQ
jgi:hypothetical protein